jgi:UDP-3-O-[3-hydroxymyristoyl] N-acetylglucosamine deacetylase
MGQGAARQATLEGRGLHTGDLARVTLREAPGAVRLAGRVGGAGGVRIDELEVVSTARATTVRARSGGEQLGTVEHALAAFAGLGIYEGVEMSVEGPEMPLLDGGASRWCEAISSLSPPRRRPTLRVVRELVIDVGPSRYEFFPDGTSPASLGRGPHLTEAGVDVEVRLTFDDPRIATTARWQGDAADFVARIAPARTFALAREVEELLRRGLARHVDPACVVLIAPDAIHHSGKPFAPDEPARHKLLDLLGDLYLAGGPPLGRVIAHRPGHAANARAISRALEAEALSRG